MKTIITISLFLLSHSLLAQKGENIIGNWLTSDGLRKINIYSQDNKYFGKIIWVKNEDKKNEIGKVVMMNLEFKDNEYDDGTFLMPSEKHNASCAAKITTSNVLQITLYHGLKVFGHSIYLSKTIQNGK